MERDAVVQEVRAQLVLNHSHNEVTQNQNLVSLVKKTPNLKQKKSKKVNFQEILDFGKFGYKKLGKDFREIGYVTANL